MIRDIEHGARVILLAEDDVVGKSNAEEVAFAQVKIKPYDNVVRWFWLLRIATLRAIAGPVGCERAGPRIEPAFPDQALAVVPVRPVERHPILGLVD